MTAVLLAPALSLLIVALGYPLLYSFWLSFHDWTIQSFRRAVPFVGFANYARLLSEPAFWRSLGVTSTFMLGALTLEFACGIGLALLLNQNLRARAAMRSVILLPMMATNVVIGLVWRMMMNYDAGVNNWALGLLGIGPVQWLSEPANAVPSLILVDVWNTTSFVALIVLAGLQAIPDEPLEAALMDGATRMQRFRFITLPLLRPALLVALVWRVIDTFRIFDVVFTLTGGGPANATEVISLFAYRAGFQKFDLGYASASSYAMILIMLIVSSVLFRWISRAEQLY